MKPILIQPHDDDAFLFACFTAIREKPLIVTVFDSYVQPARGIPGCSKEGRARETDAACKVIGLQWVRLGFHDDDQSVKPSDILRYAVCSAARFGFDGGDPIYAPAFESGGHEQHNLVATAFRGLPNVGHYASYTRDRGKSVIGSEVPFESHWVALKLRALACFESQFQPTTGCVDHFVGRSLREYLL